MRAMVFFDLPTLTAAQKKSYRLFRKFLIKDGYLMLQKSVYAKLVVSDAAFSAAVVRLKKQRPKEGLIQVLKVSEKQYSTMVYIVGSQQERSEIDSMEELLVL